MMKSSAAILSALIFLDGVSVPGAATAADYKVVVNAANPLATLTRAAVARIFLKKTTTWPNGHSADPIDQPTSSATRRAFSKDVLGMDTREVATYLNQLIFSGRGVPPLTKPSDAEVLSYIRNSANAIGYVAEDAKLEEGVKVLALKD
jgi:ABC-type phosphate transport system substrate-binding protein